MWDAILLFALEDFPTFRSELILSSLPIISRSLWLKICLGGLFVISLQCTRSFFLASPDILTSSPDIWLNLTVALRRTFSIFAGLVRHVRRTSCRLCGSKIPSLGKEFLVQHRDHGIALSIQWFCIESKQVPLRNWSTLIPFWEVNWKKIIRVKKNYQSVATVGAII